MKTLHAQNSILADSVKQLEILNSSTTKSKGVLSFKEKLNRLGFKSLKPVSPEILQMNLGKMCNQTCNHCHVDAGPDRKEIMTKATMELCLDALRNSNIPTVDLTGGAPELNPDFRWFVGEIHKLKRKIMVRSNLTIILANPKFHDLPDFFKKHDVEIISSLPCYTESNTDAQRGKGVFNKSIAALKMLNEVGYGKPDTRLEINLVYNPGGASLPPSQESLEQDYKKQLKENFGIDFNNLYVITNMPISRFLDFLLISGKYEEYMQKLITAFNPITVENLMCRNTLSVGWDGSIYDCDFNQMLDLKINKKDQEHIKNFNIKNIPDREIVLGDHCYGCTAGAGSSCGGELLSSLKHSHED